MILLLSVVISLLLLDLCFREAQRTHIWFLGDRIVLRHMSSAIIQLSLLLFQTRSWSNQVDGALRLVHFIILTVLHLHARVAFLASRDRRSLFTNLLHFLFLLLIDWWQVVLNHLILPITHHPVSFSLLRRIILILDVKSRVGFIVPNIEFRESFCKHISPCRILLQQMLSLLLFLNVS